MTQPSTTGPVAAAAAQSSQEEANKALVLDYLEAFGSFDPDRYEAYLVAEPVYWIGMRRQVGKAAFHENAAAGKVLWPDPSSVTSKTLALTAGGDWVAVLTIRSGPTNRVPDYQNVYAVFCEVTDGLIVTQVELLDQSVAAAGFDLSQLGA